MQFRTVKDEVAQLVMPRVEGKRLSEPAYRAEILSQAAEGLGGFILFGGDVERTPRDLAELQTRAPVPLLIASDVERGLGQQLDGGTRFPSQRAVAAAVNRKSRKDGGLLHSMLDAVRTETRAAGIHLVFSPVVDVNNNPANPIICTRAFGEDPETVEWFGARYIRGLQKPRPDGTLELLACAKHFPGHGDTDQDSHSVLPVIRADRGRLNRVELPPFREAVKAGVGTVMIAHLLVPALDPVKPVTFSKKAVTALLREGMEFPGLIVSDALDMGALAGQYTQEDIAVRAVEAGIDILLHPVDARLTINAVARAVEEGRLTEERIHESLERILEAKRRLGLLNRKNEAAAAVDYEKHRKTARELARKALKIAGGDKKKLPLKAEAGVVCFVLDDDALEGVGSALLSAMGERFPGCATAVFTPERVLPAAERAALLAPHGSVVIGIFSRIKASKGSSGLSPKLREAAAELLSSARKDGKRAVVISFDSPYILGQFRDADLQIAAYDRMDDIQQAAAEFLTRGPGR